MKEDKMKLTPYTLFKFIEMMEKSLVELESAKSRLNYRRSEYTYTLIVLDREIERINNQLKEFQQLDIKEFLSNVQDGQVDMLLLNRAMYEVVE